MVRPSLQSALEPPALDLLPISKHVCQICRNFLRFLTSSDLDLRLKIGTLIYGCPRNVYANFDFSAFFVYTLQACTEQMDGQDVQCGL